MDVAGGQVEGIGRAFVVGVDVFVVVVSVSTLQMPSLNASRLVKAVPFEQVPPVT